jgi:DNA-binding transcriptional ArsR family regulator
MKADALDVLGDPTRRSIVEILRAGPQAVGQIAARLPVSRPAVSRHLRILSDAGLVVASIEGTRHLYRLLPDGFARVRDYWAGFWADALEQFRLYAEGSAR